MRSTLVILLCLSSAANAWLFLRTNPSTSVVAPSPAARRDPPPESRNVFDDAFWQRAADADPSALKAIQNAGLPPELSRALLRAAFAERFNEKEKALYSSSADIKYWSATYSAALHAPKDHVAYLDLRREQEALLDQWTPGWREEEASDDPDAAFLPGDKARQAKMIEEDFNALIGNIRGPGNGSSGIIMPGDREKVGFLEKERRAELAQLLTPKELEDYDLRNSSTARSLRFNLSTFAPTEQEFRGIFQIQKNTVDDKFPSDYSLQTAEQRSGREQAQEEANAQIKALLGEQRYADFTRAQDNDYRAFTAIADRLQLPSERAAEAYRLKTALEEKLNAGVPSATPEARAARLATWSQEADREFTRVLGAKGYDVYKQYGELPRRLKMDPTLSQRPPKN